MSDPLDILRDIVRAHDQFERDTGMKCRDSITEAVNRARDFLNSDTPRTDAAVLAIAAGRQKGEVEFFVSINDLTDLARQIERELSNCRANVEETRAALLASQSLRPEEAATFRVRHTGTAVGWTPKDERGWIPCSERVPENYRTVLTAFDYTQSTGYWNGKRWFIDIQTESDPMLIPTHWRELPPNINQPDGDSSEPQCGTSEKKNV